MRSPPGDAGRAAAARGASLTSSPPAPPGQPGVAVANEADKITAFVGGALHDKLRAYCAKLVDRPVRGRTPAQLAADAAARQALYDEVDDELKRTVPIVINDPADAEVRLRAYLTHKLR